MKSKINKFPIIILIALCFVSYCRTFDVPFIFDDFACVEKNPFIRDFGNYFNKRVIETYYSASGVLEDTLNNFITRPITYFTFSVNYYLHGLTVAGYHFVNILIHTLNVIFVYLLVQVTVRLLYEKDVQPIPVITPPDSLKIALLTASLFAVHPLMTNAVTYITQRMTSLVTLFYLASILLYAYYGVCHNKPEKVTFYVFSVFSCCTAMLTKETAFTLPLMLALYDMVFCQGFLRQRIIRLTPFLLSMAILPYNLIRLDNSETPQVGGAVMSSLNLVNFSHISSWEYLLTQFRAVVFYLKLLFMPLGLSLEHDFRMSSSFTESGVIFSLLLHLSILGYGSYILWASRSGRKPNYIEKLAGFGIFWFYITLLPTSSVIPLNEMAVEYRTYLPSFGIFLFTVCQIHRLFENCFANRYRFRADYFLWIPVLCMLMYLTMMRNEVWRKPAVFWKQTISLYPKLARPYANLADYYINRGALKDAIQVYSSSIQEMPYEPVLHYELGIVYILSKEHESAIAALSQAIIMKPDMKKAYERLSQAYFYSGRHEQALDTLKIADRLSHGK